MRRSATPCAVLTPPEPCVRGPVQAPVTQELSDAETDSTGNARLEKALRQLGCMVATAVADASHKTQTEFVAAVQKHDCDRAMVQKMYQDMRLHRPLMFRRLRAIAEKAHSRPRPRREAAPHFHVETWLRQTAYTLVRHLGPRAAELQHASGSRAVLKHTFSSRASLLRELRCLCLTTGMQAVCQARLTPDGGLGAIWVRGQVAALLLDCVDGVPLSLAVRMSGWLRGAEQCAACLCGAVSRLHQASLLHGDLHTGNIVVHHCGMQVTLCDLGNTAFVEEGIQKYGTRGWKAPEIRHVTSAEAWHSPFVCGSKGRALDVWALSVTLLCMACSVPRFAEDGDTQDGKLHGLARDIQRDMDLWARRHTLSREGPWLERLSPVWEVAAAGLQTSPHARLTAARLAQLLTSKV
jgi:hypothetical protein